MTTVSPTAELAIKRMKHSVAKALERKRRLGQYAVVSGNGKLTCLQPEDINPLAAEEDQAPDFFK